MEDTINWMLCAVLDKDKNVIYRGRDGEEAMRIAERTNYSHLRFYETVGNSVCIRDRECINGELQKVSREYVALSEIEIILQAAIRR